MFKNVATKILFFAFDTTTGAAKTGDASNLSAYVSKDYGSVTQLADTSATELDAANAKGWYLFDVAQAESNADALLFTAASMTANVACVGQYIFTTPASFTSFVTPTGATVAAVSGAVGSVTGNVGGNVVGSVASVVGAVGSVTGLTASNLDATVSSRSTYAGGAVASVTAAVTVAGTVDANVAEVNGVSVTGTGTSGDPWGPA